MLFVGDTCVPPPWPRSPRAGSSRILAAFSQSVLLSFSALLSLPDMPLSDTSGRSFLPVWCLPVAVRPLMIRSRRREASDDPISPCRLPATVRQAEAVARGRRRRGLVWLALSGERARSHLRTMASAVCSTEPESLAGGNFRKTKCTKELRSTVITCVRFRHPKDSGQLGATNHAGQQSRRVLDCLNLPRMHRKFCNITWFLQVRIGR